jgi:hypothetical protein
MCRTTFRNDIEFRCTSILENVFFKRLHQEHALRRYASGHQLDNKVMNIMNTKFDLPKNDILDTFGNS